MALRFPNIQEDLRLRVSRMSSIVSVSEADSDICTLNQRVLVGFRSVWVSNILFPKMPRSPRAFLRSDRATAQRAGHSRSSQSACSLAWMYVSAYCSHAERGSRQDVKLVDGESPVWFNLTGLKSLDSMSR